jgi:four helix bundle protein
MFSKNFSTGAGCFHVHEKIPAYEQFEMGQQLRRSARSVPANLVEGWAKRSSPADFERLLQVSIGSRDECKFWLEFTRHEGYFDANESGDLSNRFGLVGGTLKSLWKNS